MEITSVSTKWETISLEKPVNVNFSKRHVEKWMHELDVQVKYTLKTRIRQLIEKMNCKLSPTDSILSEPIQVAALYLKIAFTWQMENSMKQNSMTILASELKICIRECQHAVIHKRERYEFLPLLYHIYKSATHLVNKFINEQVIFIDDYRWMSQLRYYWHMENVFLRVGTVSTRYEYEVHGIDYAIDYKLIDETVANFIYMNHFGFSAKSIDVDANLARQVALALGKPFIICDTEQEMDSKMLIEGALLFGGIVFVQNKFSDKLGRNTEKDVYTCHNLSNLKYHFESEITFNSSFMFILPNSFRTARERPIGVPSYFKTIDETLSLNGIVHREKKLQKFRIISEFEAYTRSENLLRIHLDTMLKDIIGNERVEQEQSVENMIFKCLNSSMNEKNKKLLEKLLQLAPSQQSSTSFKSPESSDIPKTTVDNDPIYVKEKTEDLLNMLQNHQVVVVCGGSWTGKSRIIEKAAKIKDAELEIGYGQWEDLEKFGESLRNMRRRNKWIVIDGLICGNTKQWLQRLANESTVFFWRELPIIASCERVIVETDCLTPDLNMFPVIYLDQSADFLKETTLDAGEQHKLDEACNMLSEFKFRKIELIRKVERLKKLISTKSEKVFDHLLVTALLSFVPLKTITHFFFKSEKKLMEFYKDVPYSKGWYSHKDSMEIQPSHFYIIHTIGLILQSDFIPLLTCPPSQEFYDFLSRLQTELDALGWHTMTMSIDEKTTITEIQQFIDNCSIMFGGRQIQDDGIDDVHVGSNFFLIRGLENASIEVINWLRYKFERRQIMKMLIVTPCFVDSFPRRVQRFFFQINWMDFNGEPSLTLYPLANYVSILKSLTKDIKQKEASDAIQNQLIDAMLDARMLNLYEKVSELKTSEQYSLVRGKSMIEPDELCSIYKSTLQKLCEKSQRIRCDSISLSISDAQKINVIERVIQTSYGHTIIVGNEVSKSINAVTISTELNNLVLYTNHGIRTLDEWKDIMNRVLRDCLIDGKATVLRLTIVPGDDEIAESILADATSICCYKMIPPRCLTKLILSEFGEKHTLEGKGIWEMIETKLSALRISIVLRSTDFSWFMNSHRRLLTMLILISWGDPSKKEQEQETLDKLNNCKLFSKQHMDTIMKAIDELCGMKMINTRAEKQKMISTIIKLASKKREEVQRTMSKYEKGMEKMKRAEEQVVGMQGELLRLQPQLVRTSIETSMLMSTIEKETIDVENAREVVAANENKANEAATKAQSLKAESENELASAIPALESAVESLETMTQNDVSSLKTMRFPPYAVRLCMEAVCILLGVKPAKINNEKGEVVNDYWVSGQKLLSDIHFLAKIRSFPRDAMSKKTMRLIREKYLSKEEFDPENVKQCSLAAEGLCRWVLAIDMYNQISKIVEPKRERLRKAEVLVKQHLKQLEVKRKALLKVTEKLQALSDQFSQMCQKKQELESQIASCEIKMERAERLVQALSGEKDKWKTKIRDIKHEDSLCVPYSVGSALALHIFGKLPIDQRETKLRKTMRALFPKLEVTIPCDLRTLVMLVEDPICFVNDENRALHILQAKFEKVVVSSRWTEDERQQCLAPNSVFLLETCMDNIGIAKEIEEAHYFSHIADEIILKIGNTDHEVNKNFRVFIRAKRNDIVLRNSVIIDSQFSDGELRNDICEKMGSANWPETLNHYNEMVESRNNDIAMMEKTENEMLDLLGRSKDLDDERAIDLLTEVRNLQASVTARNKEIAEIENSLRSIESQMSQLIDYSLQVIKMCYSLRLLDPFYRISLHSLVNVLETKMIENIADYKFGEISHKISDMFWNFFSHLLAWDDKIIVHHLLFKKMNYKVEKLELQMADRLSMDSFLNFSTFIAKSDPKQVILMKYDAEAYATLLQFSQVTRNVKWSVYSILDHALLKLEKLADDAIWLILSINENDHDAVSKLKSVTEKLNGLPIVHSSFRIIIAYSDEILCSDELITLSSRRFYFSGAASLAQQTQRFIANLAFKSSLDKSEEKQRIQIIRLISFHYGVKLRKKFDPEFNINVDDSDLLAMMRLYQELRNLSDQPNEIQDVMKVKTSVIDPIYSSKTKCPVQRNIINSMIQWIVEANLSPPADTVLRKIIREDNHNFEDFAHFMQSNDDSILCGFNSRISRECREMLDRKVILRMKQLFEPATIKNGEVREKRGPSSCLMDVENGTRELDGRTIENLSELVTFLKVQFSLKYKFGTAEVMVTGKFVDDNYEFPKIGPDSEIPMLKISHCTLISAHIEQGHIRESQTLQKQYISILLTTSKRTASGNPTNLPFICPFSKNSVAQIPFDTQFPIAHWHLRGAFVTTARLI